MGDRTLIICYSSLEADFGMADGSLNEFAGFVWRSHPHLPICPVKVRCFMFIAAVDMDVQALVLAHSQDGPLRMDC